MPRIEAALGQLFGEYPPVGCVTHRIYGGSTGNDVIGLVEGPPAPGLAEIVGDHNLGAVLADDPADHSAQRHAVLQNPVRQPQKLHDVDTDELRRLDLLCLTHSAALIWGQAIDARLTAGDHRVADRFARVGPPGHGRRRAEFKIIRMSNDAQGGAPRLVDGCKIRHSVRLIRRTIGVPEVASGRHPVPEITLQPTQIGKASIDFAIPHQVVVNGYPEDATYARAKRHLCYVCREGRQQLRSQPSGAQQPSTLRAIGDHNSGRVRRTHALKPDTRAGPAPLPSWPWTDRRLLSWAAGSPGWRQQLASPRSAIPSICTNEPVSSVAAGHRMSSLTGCWWTMPPLFLASQRRGVICFARAVARWRLSSPAWATIWSPQNYPG